MFEIYSNTILPINPQPPCSHNFLLLGTSKGLVIIETGKILRVEAISNYCKIFFIDAKSLVVAKLLSWFEENLNGLYFTRLHRSHLVNMNYIRSYNTLNGAEVVLTNDEKLSVSRRKRIEFKKAIHDYYSSRHRIASA